jgi:hypothetical protein
MQAIKTIPKTKTLSFYKENGLWYADLPQFLALGLGTKANLLMVDGADTFLDLLSNNGVRTTVRFGKEPFSNHDIHLKKVKIGLNQDLLNQIGHAPVNYGAYYNVLKYQNQSLQHTLWLCPVAEFVFNGEYPENIYLKKI